LPYFKERLRKSPFYFLSCAESTTVESLQTESLQVESAHFKVSTLEVEVELEQEAAKTTKLRINNTFFI